MGWLATPLQNLSLLLLPAGMPRRPCGAGSSLLQLLLLGAARANNLLSDGGFAAQPSALTGDYVGSAGAFERVTAADGMRDFPGDPSAAALQLLPGARFVVRSAAANHAAGWYRVRGFIYASGAYDGAAAPLTVDIVDSAGASAPHASSHRVALRPQRDQWLHYDEWVPSTYAGSHRAKLSFTPAHGAGVLQLAQLEVTFETFEARQSHDTAPLTMWLDPANYPAGAPTSVACSASGPGECPDNWQGDGEIYYAFDGNLDTVYYMSSQNVPLIALELDLGETVEVCGATVVYNGGLDASWRLKGRTEQGSWSTWAEAGPAGSGKMITTTTTSSNGEYKVT